MTIDESLQIDDMHINEFLRQAYWEAAMYELEQYAKEVEKEKQERGENDNSADL